METSAEAWATLAGLLDQGSLAVMWHEGSGSSRSDFDTVLELRGGAILERTYQQGKVAGVAGHVQPGKFCNWRCAKTTSGPITEDCRGTTTGPRAISCPGVRGAC